MFDDDFPREISPDEGYRREEWADQAQKEAFFAHALPCESCGQPVYGERKRAWWDDMTWIGPCCTDPLFESIPETASCEGLWEALKCCTTVHAVSVAMASHISECETCKALRPEVERIEPQYDVQADGTHVFRKKAA